MSVKLTAFMVGDRVRINRNNPRNGMVGRITRIHEGTGHCVFVSLDGSATYLLPFNEIDIMPEEPKDTDVQGTKECGRMKPTNWIPHNATATIPERVRGLRTIDIVFPNGTGMEDVDWRLVKWDNVQLWRKHGVENATQSDVQSTLNDRGKTHGDFTQQAATSQALKNLMRQTPNWQQLHPFQREALETEAMKISRILHGDPNEPDHWRDTAGYATLVENILLHGKSHLG